MYYNAWYLFYIMRVCKNRIIQYGNIMHSKPIIIYSCRAKLLYFTLNHLCWNPLNRSICIESGRKSAGI